MKKLFIIFMLLAALAMLSTKCFAQSAYNQGEDTNYWNNQGTHSSSDEDARYKEGCGFDRNCGSSPPVVDLRDAGEHPTPQLLRNSDGSNPYTPQQYRSLHTTPPPPLP